MPKDEKGEDLSGRGRDEGKDEDTTTGTNVVAGSSDSSEAADPGDPVLSNENYRLQIMRELWDEERRLLEELIHCRVVNKRIRQENLMSGRLAQILEEIERDQNLVMLVEARNQLQRRLQDLPTSNLGAMYHRQQELMDLIHGGRSATANALPPGLVPSAGTTSGHGGPNVASLPAEFDASAHQADTPSGTIPSTMFHSGGNIALGSTPPPNVPPARSSGAQDHLSATRISSSRSLGDALSPETTQQRLRRSRRLAASKEEDDDDTDDRKPPATKSRKRRRRDG